MERATIRAFLLGAAAVDVVFPLTVGVLDVLGGLDPTPRALSLHELRPGFPWMRFAFLAHALALELLAVGLYRLPPRPYAGPLCLRLAGAAAALLAIFPPDLSSEETVTGHLHETFAMIAFLGIAAGALFASHAMGTSPAWRGLWKLPATFAAGLIASASTLGLFVLFARLDARFRSYYGLGERVTVLFIGAWFVSAAIQGVRVTRREARPRGVE